MNIDPFNQYTDDDLWDALEKAHFKQFINSLQFECLEGGENLRY